jgi:hypothetical protein
MNTMNTRTNKGLISSIFILGIFVMSPVMLAAQEAAPEMDKTYGSEGTREVGLNGSLTLPMLITDGPEGSPEKMGPTSLSLQPFFKFFLANHLHADLRLLLQTSHTEKTETQEESSQTIAVFFPSIGYTLPITPKFQLDATLNVGSLSYSVMQGGTDMSDTAFSYGFSLMALSPISESAVIGVGVIFTWTSLDLGSDELGILQRVFPLQVSYYF